MRLETENHAPVWLRRACSRTGQRWARTGPMAGVTVTRYDAPRSRSDQTSCQKDQQSSRLQAAKNQASWYRAHHGVVSSPTLQRRMIRG
jgi:hypothetical protein